MIIFMNYKNVCSLMAIFLDQPQTHISHLFQMLDIVQWTIIKLKTNLQLAVYDEDVFLKPPKLSVYLDKQRLIKCF